MHISIVSPVYGCAACIKDLVQGILNAMNDLDCTNFEIILIDDCSPDNPWPVIQEISKLTPQLKGVRLSRNFGQHAAIQAGLEEAKGDWVIVMDCDLQDKPSEIPKLYNKALEGYDLVLGRRESRNDSWLKRKTSQWFYGTLSYLTDTKIDPAVANFGVYKKAVIKAILSMGDYVRFFPSMSAWVGFKKIGIPIEHATRDEGKSSYNFKSLIRLGLSVILSFSDKPLRVVVKFGFIITGLVLLSATIIFIQFLLGRIEVLGYTSLILSVWFFGGVVISLLGLIGLYVGKTFDQVKNRPVFIVAETTDQK